MSTILGACDAPFQATDHTDPEGANKVSLLQARINYKEFEACEYNMRKNVRPPKTDEIPENIIQGIEMGWILLKKHPEKHISRGAILRFPAVCPHC